MEEEMPKDIPKNDINKGWFKKGHKFCGDLTKSNYFQKGNIPWNKEKKCLQLAKKNHSNWKGGKTIHKGYILVKSWNHPFCDNHSYVKEHRLIIEKQIGRYLHKWEISHHINKIRNDNRPKNLMAFSSNSAHKKFEWGKKIKSKEIIFDGRTLN